MHATTSREIPPARFTLHHWFISWARNAWNDHLDIVNHTLAHTEHDMLRTYLCGAVEWLNYCEMKTLPRPQMNFWASHAYHHWKKKWAGSFSWIGVLFLGSHPTNHLCFNGLYPKKQDEAPPPYYSPLLQPLLISITYVSSKGYYKKVCVLY